MKQIAFIFVAAMLLLSCNPPRTVYISNKTDSPIRLLVDSSYQNTHLINFKDSINGLKIDEKKVFNYGGGKWTEADKTSLEDLIKHTKIVREGSATAIDMPGKTKVSLISLNVEELWINIK
jgi:hypothetical protein